MAAIFWSPLLAASQDFTYVISNGEVAITGYSGLAAEIVIPNTIEGLPVTRIAEAAFQENEFIISLTMGAHITHIEDLAFYDCYNLSLVDLGSALVSIGDSAFAYCDSLTSITIPDRVTNLGNSAFSGTSLTSITIPDRVISIGHYSFTDCYDLASVTIGNVVQSIGVNAFTRCSSLKEISIPSSVTSIGDHAFSSCTLLEEVTIGSGLTQIDYKAFTNCTSLSHIYFEGDAPTLASDVFRASGSPVAHYLATASGWTSSFGGLQTAQWYPYTYNIENGQVSITGYTGATRDITLPDSVQGLPVTGIADDAFRDQTTLISIRFPDSLAHIGENAFTGCSSLKAFWATQANPNFTSIRGVLFDNERETLIAFPPGAFGFRGTYHIPTSATHIANEAFADASKLSHIIIPEGVLTIGEGAFRNCIFTDITIPASVTSIAERAFSNCSRLASIHFQGDAPAAGTALFASVPDDAVAYYLSSTTGWDETYAGLPAIEWNPEADYRLWIAGFVKVGSEIDIMADPDNDGQVNALENILGTNPSQYSSGIIPISFTANTVTFRHSLNPTPASDLALSYEWSTNLHTFYASGASGGAGATTVTFSQTPDPNIENQVNTTATISGPKPSGLVFVRLKITQGL